MKCPVCNNNTFDDTNYEWDICKECFFEWDPLQVKDSDYWGGANYLSLNDYKKLYFRLKKENPVFSCKNNDDMKKIVELSRNIRGKLSKEQLDILDKYNIKSDVIYKRDLLINIDDVMTDYVDENDEPTEDFLILEKLYDDIYDNLKSDVSSEKEKEFISHYGKDIRVTFKNGNTLEGHCDSFARRGDTEHDEPELTISSNKGNISFSYSEVNKIEVIEVDDNIKNLPKCPKCGNKLVEIMYGMPSSDIIEKVEKGEIFLGGCMIDDVNPIYHCNTCERSYFENLKDYIEEKNNFNLEDDSK